MTFAEIRKAVVAVLGTITAVIPQILGTLTGIIPENVASWLTIIAAVATAILVYLVPNAPADPLAKVRTSVDALGPLFDVIRARVNEEIAARLPMSPRVQAHAREPEVQPDPLPPADPFVVPPLGR